MILKLSQQIASIIIPPGRSRNTELTAKAKPTSEVRSKAIGFSRISTEAPSKDSFQRMSMKRTYVLTLTFPFHKYKPQDIMNRPGFFYRSLLIVGAHCIITANRSTKGSR